MTKEETMENTAATELSKNVVDSVLKENTETVYMESGNIGFDMALSNGKGIPVGSSTLLWADPGCGKSTALADVSRRLLKKHKDQGIPFKVLYLAVEGSRQLMRDIGLAEYMDSQDFIYVEKPLCWRQIEQFYDAVLGGKHKVYKDVKVIIIDSVNNVLSDANLNKSVADGDFGTKAKERGLFYSKYFPQCRGAGVTTFLIAQVRQNQDAGANPYMDKRKAAVSWADRHNVDIIIKCSANTSSKDAKKVITKTAFGENKDILGWIFKMDSSGSSCKNRYFKGLAAEMYLSKGKGADNAYAIRKFLEFNGFIKASGGWLSFSKELCETFNIPEGNLRREVVMDIIRNNMGAFVEFLKNMGLYNLEPQIEATSEDTQDEADE